VEDRSHNAGSEDRSEVTRALESLNAGDRSAAERLIPLVYRELRSLAAAFLRRERPDHALQPTELVNEAYLRLVDQNRVDWQGKTHFFAVGAQAMRRVLVDHARSRLRRKRGSGVRPVEFSESLHISSEREGDVLALEEALQTLEKLDPAQARIVELRFYGGLTVAEVAEVMGLSKRSVEREWTMIRAWLRRELS
jgi:RNA polymerase sigma-70 factor (ECF subfamily)